jgi:hypothetical protein
MPPGWIALGANAFEIVTDAGLTICAIRPPTEKSVL